MNKLSALLIVICLILNVSAQTVVLSEDFSLIVDSTSYSIASNINTYTQTQGWTADRVYPCTGKIKVGTSSVAGYIQTPSIDLSANNGQFVISFDAEAWVNDNQNLKVIVNSVEYTVNGLENDGSYGSYTHFELPLSGGTSATTIRFQSYQASRGRFFLDNIVVTSQSLGPDTVAPYIASVVPSTSTLSVQFNEVLDATSAQTVSNYTLDSNITISTATLSGSVVTLAVTPNLTEGNSYTLVASNIADTAGNVMGSDTVTFTYGVSSEFQCANIAELRSKHDFSDYTVNVAGSVEYKITGDVIITAVASYNNQKVLQDASGAILVYDPDNTLDPNGTLEVGDKINGLYGTLTNYYGFLEFKPTSSFENRTAIYQEVEPMEITLSQLNDQTFMIQHQAELIKLSDVSFTEAGNSFATLTTYEINQNGTIDTAVYPYFQDANYIGSTIPSNNVNLTGVNFATSKIGNNYPDFRYYIVPRSTGDFTTGIRNYEQTISVYPNSANDVVTFQLSAEIEQVMIYDLNGKLVANETVTNNRVNISTLNHGIYFARMYQNNEVMGTAKIVKY